MKPPLSIVDACRDPAIFGPWFRDGLTWQAWFAFLAVLFGLPLSPDQLAIYQQCTGRTAPPAAPFYEAWLICGRRAGKSFMLAMIAVFLGCFCNWRPYLVPGETGRIVIIAADRRQARVIFGYVLGFLENVPMLSGMTARQTQDTIDLANGLSIEIQAASFKTVRGYSLVACLADEVAFWQVDEGGANPDTEILRSIRPALASIRGSMLLVASSPYAERGALWNSHRRHHGVDGSPVLTWQAPTRTMNPSIPESVIAEAYESDPASAAAEYGAQFRSDISQFIDRALLEAAVDSGVASRPADRRFQHVAFADAASGVGGPDGDRFGLSLGHRDGDRIIIDYVRTWTPPFNASQVVVEIADVCRGYGVSELASDRFSHGFVQAECQRNGLTWRPSEMNKSQLYLNALPNLTSGRIRLLDVPSVVDEFALLERRPGAGGNDRVDARGGKREDGANCVAGVIGLLSKPMSGPEGWLEYYRRLVEEPRNFATDFDDIRAAGGDWNFTNEPLLQVIVPPPIAAEGGMDVDGRWTGFRHIGHDTICEMRREDAADLLRRSPAWREKNQHLAGELLGEKIK